MRYITTLAVLALVTGAAPTLFTPRPTPAPDDFAVRFDRMDERINGGRGYSESLNTDGVLAWGEGYLLDAYVELYHATGSASYLDNLVDHFDRVLTLRDDHHHRIDHLRKTALAGWGSDQYSHGQWHVWAVHTGMICLGPAEFVAAVKGEYRLRKRFAAKSDEYLQRIKECVAVFDREWRDGPAADEGHYADPMIGPVPLNQQNALGLVELELYLITRDHAYKDRVAKLARYFQRRLRKRPDGACDWSYWPKPEGDGPASEDISHGAIDIEFAVRCRDAHIVFNDLDIRAFGKTWTAHIRRAPGEWADTVAGTGGPNTYVPEAVGRWVALSPWETTVYDDARLALASADSDKADAATMLGLAKLALRQHQMTQKKRLRLPRVLRKIRI